LTACGCPQEWVGNQAHVDKGRGKPDFLVDVVNACPLILFCLQAGLFDGEFRIIL